MPIYEYKCKSCNKVTEKEFPVSTYPKAIRCSCGKPAFKIVSGPGIQFKGKGFYSTDNKKNG